MKKYLKMSDVFDMQPIRLPSSWSYEMVAHAVHAIDIHDELVAMNKELLAALEEIADAFSPMRNPKEWRRADVHQRTLDLARTAIAKAKAES